MAGFRQFGGFPPVFRRQPFAGPSCFCGRSGRGSDQVGARKANRPRDSGPLLPEWGVRWRRWRRRQEQQRNHWRQQRRELGRYGYDLWRDGDCIPRCWAVCQRRRLPRRLLLRSHGNQLPGRGREHRQPELVLPHLQSAVRRRLLGRRGLSAGYALHDVRGKRRLRLRVHSSAPVRRRRPVRRRLSLLWWGSRALPGWLQLPDVGAHVMRGRLARLCLPRKHLHRSGRGRLNGAQAPPPREPTALSGLSAGVGRSGDLGIAVGDRHGVRREIRVG